MAACGHRERPYIDALQSAVVYATGANRPACGVTKPRFPGATGLLSAMSAASYMNDRVPISPRLKFLTAIGPLPARSADDGRGFVAARMNVR